MPIKVCSFAANVNLIGTGWGKKNLYYTNLTCGNMPIPVACRGMFLAQFRKNHTNLRICGIFHATFMFLIWIFRSTYAFSEGAKLLIESDNKAVERFRIRSRHTTSLGPCIIRLRSQILFWLLIITSPVAYGRSAEYCDRLSVGAICLSLAYLKNHMSKFHEIFSTYYTYGL